MRRVNSCKRCAFSLLEMVLALAIGMMLLAALYVTLNAQVNHAQAGRDILAEGTLARSILNRISEDILGQVGPADPRLANSSTPGAGASTSGNNSTTSSSTTSSNNSSSTSSANASSDPQSGAANVTFNVGVLGDATSMTLSTYRVQKPPTSANMTQESGISSDLRVVSYWLAGAGADSQGLARKEFRQATGTQINQSPSSLPDQSGCVIAPEVSSLQIEYFDGTNWQTSWDGTITETLGAPPIGPPVAIRVTITLFRGTKMGATNDLRDEGASDPSYQHIIALPTANFFNQSTTSP